MDGERLFINFFQFHHTQMDGAHAGKFLKNLQEEIARLPISVVLNEKNSCQKDDLVYTTRSSR